MLTSSEVYQRQFVKDALTKLKMAKVEELCKVIEVSISSKCNHTLFMIPSLFDRNN